MTYEEEDLLPISALQHLVFCERQAALIHVEQLWRDNHLTLEGSHLHRRADEVAPRREVRGDLVIVRGLSLRSLRLGLVGRADVVEFHRTSCAGPADAHAAALPGLEGTWAPFPVEYKRGRPKRNRCDEVQLCAQALCLEERFSVAIPRGALYYGRQQRRRPVSFDEELRAVTEQAALRFRQIVTTGETPKAVKTKKCESCSLLDVCLPQAMRGPGSVKSYVQRALRLVEKEEEEISCDDT